MESLPRKLKGARSVCSLVGSLHDAALKRTCHEPKPCPKKKATAASSGDTSGRGRVVMTAPPASGAAASESPGRGLKRKLGCIKSAMRMGRKKRLESEYELGGEIGKGKFGCVRICRARAGGEEFVCKALPKNGEETVHREVEIMQHLSGRPGVVTLKAVFEDADKFYLVIEFCGGGRLLDEMAREGRFSKQRAANVIKELMAVVKYCHEMGVVHRDIKPENILLTKAGKMKLADFGLAARVTNGRDREMGEAVGRAAEDLRAALIDHADLVADLFGRVSSDLRHGFAPAVDTFISFFHAIDWKETSGSMAKLHGSEGNNNYRDGSGTYGDAKETDLG